MTPGFWPAMAGSFHLVMVPRKILAMVGPSSLRAGIAGQIVGEDDRAGDGGDVEDLAGGLGEIRVAHRAIGRAKIDRLRDDLLLAAAGADGLVIEADGGIDLRVFVEPLRVNRVGEGRAGAGHGELRREALARPS